ncbi:substrate-binding domain-containing protein [Mesoterricola silvestris]|uniref:Sugar ABC transporter substrate-binding protein n=1 Tax=Mesoterricola silvestris TaxID=2927979 RepID=A0AA48GWS2_9BACT|nr:substrate-binding domain-containing protein [Mesoterricola silvestris]BDU73291.1 sugar ABC transporter substrate-binding protein [Mesoterricola silvestris]
MVLGLAVSLPLLCAPGPAPGGPRGVPGKTIAFIASDSRNGGVTGVFRAFQDAAGLLGWKASFQDGNGRKARQGELLLQAIQGRADGIIFGGFDAGDFPAEVAAARRAGIPLVGWHAARNPGPSRDLFLNVATDPAAVAALAVRFVVQDAVRFRKPVGVVIFTDSRFEVARAKTLAMVRALEASRKAGPCRVLAIQDIPISEAATRAPGAVPDLVAKFGAQWTYTLAINDVYFDHMNFPLAFAHRADILNVSAGDGSSLALSRIGSGRSQQAATVAEPLRMQGFQLADELNRAFAGERPSGQVSRPILVTAEVLKARGAGGIEAGSGFEAAYARIWSGR